LENQVRWALLTPGGAPAPARPPSSRADQGNCRRHFVISWRPGDQG